MRAWVGRRVLVIAAVASSFIPGTLTSTSAQAEWTAEICNAAGVCAPVDPLTALVIVGIKTIGEELNKGEKGFGPNGEIVKAINTVLGDLRRGGLGPNNDLVRAWETAKSDVLNGPGPNNDIVKFLKSMNVRL